MKPRGHHIFNILLLLTLWFSYGIAIGQNCNQNNVSIKNLQLLDEDGNLFTSGSQFELGQTVNGQIFLTLNESNSSNAFSPVIFYDLWINDIKQNGDTRIRHCLSDRANPPFNTPIFVSDVSFTWGDLVEIRNILIRWSTNSGTACSEITEGGSNAQCFSNPAGFIAELPVLPDFTFTTTTCNTFVQFVGSAIGGHPGYTYTWDFSNSQTAIGQHVSNTFPAISSYDVTMTATDSKGNQNSITKTVTIPVISISVEAIPTKLGQSTGSITVTASGGTGPYTVTWSSEPVGFQGTFIGFDPSYTIPNLGNGTYTITVTDSQGCINSITEYIDWANILSYTVENFRGSFNTTTNSVNLQWETAKELIPGIFTVERALDASLNFYSIVEINARGFSETVTTYQANDTQLPNTGGRVYYRIKFQENDHRYIYSDVISLSIPRNYSAQNWQVYPNPVQNQDLILKHTGPHNMEPLLIQLISSKGEQIQLSINPPYTEINLAPYVQTFSKGLLIVHVLQNESQQTIKVWKK